MKKLLIIFSMMLCLGLGSCTYDQKNLVYRGPAWEIHKINDSILLCIPWQTSDNNKPYLLDINQFNKKNFNLGEDNEMIIDEPVINEPTIDE